MGDVEKNNSKYSAAMRQLEELLALERETEEVKRKVAGFSLDYDDDLVSVVLAKKKHLLILKPKIFSENLMKSLKYTVV